MAKKVKESENVMEQPVQTAPVEEAATPAKMLVNCPKCGAGLYADSEDVVYMCPVCNSLMRVRIGERIIKNVR